jgi:hypothetical protein
MFSGQGRRISADASPRVTMDRCRKETAMGKRGRKKRARKKNAANHGKRPNA